MIEELKKNTYGFHLAEVLEKEKLTDKKKLANIVKWWDEKGLTEYLNLKRTLFSSDPSIETKDQLMTKLTEIVKTEWNKA